MAYNREISGNVEMDWERVILNIYISTNDRSSQESELLSDQSSIRAKVLKDPWSLLTNVGTPEHISYLWMVSENLLSE